MFAQHWSAASGTGAITIEGTPPAVFQQLLRWAYAGQCAEGALGAMADHLFEAAGKFGLPALQAAAAQQMLAALAAENVCDFFALAHAHGLDEPKTKRDICECECESESAATAAGSSVTKDES